MDINILLNSIDYEKYSGSDNIKIKGITCNSRIAFNGCLFVALDGLATDGHRYMADGHNYIKNAIENGASAVICQYIPEEVKGLSNFIIVKSSREIISKASSIIYDNPSEKLKILGVTGTNGKTSTTYLLKSIFDYVNKTSGVIGTMGAVVDNEKMKTENTTPEVSELQYFLRKMVDKPVEYCFMEVSSQALDLHRIDNVSLDVGIYTNLTRDHLDFHHNMENYYQAKKKLFYKTKINNIINIDDEYGERLYVELKKDNINAMSYSITKDADIKASNLITDMKGTKFDLTINNKTVNMHVKTPGKFSVLNSLGAMGAAYVMDIPFDEIVEAMQNNKGVTGRFQILDTKLDCTVILDFAHTPDGLLKVMETINEFAKGRKIVMFGAGGERDISRRAQMGEIAGKYCDLSILTSDNPRYENPYSICEEIAEGVKKYNGKYKIIIEREEAIYYAIDNYEKNDVILLAGKSTEPYQDMGIEKIPYDEITIAKRVVKQIEEKLKL